MDNLKFSVTIWKEKDGFVSKCPKLNIASCGDSIEEALKNIKEAVELCLENMAIIELRTVRNTYQ